MKHYDDVLSSLWQIQNEAIPRGSSVGHSHNGTPQSDSDHDPGKHGFDIPPWAHVPTLLVILSVPPYRESEGLGEKIAGIGR